MEKRISLILFALIFFTNNIYSQHEDFQKKIRIPLWAELDAYPGLAEAQDTSSGQFDYPINRLKTISPFLITGMTYGWNFTYTPYDKMRKVDEYFEVTPIAELSEKDGNIQYSKPWIQDNKLYCWVEFDRTPHMQWTYRMWNSVNVKKIKGRGNGKISDGFDGIQNAAKNALKEAIREHYREIIKNKPKEISGKVIIRKTPKVGINSGQYVIELDFLLESDRIVMYTMY